VVPSSAVVTAQTSMTSGLLHDADDALRLARLRAGDDSAFEELFRLYFVRLAAFAYLIVRSRDVASEVVHDVFLTLWIRRRQWAPAGAVQTYLFRAVRNRAYKHLAHERVETRWANDVPVALHGTPPDLHARVEASDAQRAYEHAVEALPPRAQLIYRMSREQGVRYEEIARILEISINTVETQMRRTLMRLRVQLRSYVE